MPTDLIADYLEVRRNTTLIVVDANSTGHIETLAFVIPNEDLSGHHYREYLTSIDEIEAATGLDFVSALSADEQQEFESETAAQVW